MVCYLKGGIFQCSTTSSAQHKIYGLFINTADAFSSLEEVVVQKPNPLITLGRERVKPDLMISQGKQKCVASSAGSLTIEVLCSSGKLPLWTISGVLCSVLSLFPAPGALGGSLPVVCYQAEPPQRSRLGSVGEDRRWEPSRGLGRVPGARAWQRWKVPYSHPGHTPSHPTCLFQHRAFVLFWLLIQPEATGIYLNPQSSTRSSTQGISSIWKQK